MKHNKFEALTKAQQEVFIAVSIEGFVLPLNRQGLLPRHKSAIESLIQKNIIVTIPTDHYQFKKLYYGNYLTCIHDTRYCLTHEGEAVFFDALRSNDFIGHKFDYMKTRESKKETEALAEVFRPLLNQFKSGKVDLETLVNGICKHRIIEIPALCPGTV
jgi:hypothetical protein